MLSIASVAFAGVLAAIGVRYRERRRRWRVQAGRLQKRLVAELARDTTVAGLVFVPDISVDADGVTKIAVSGVVPSEADRARVLHAVGEEVGRRFPGVRIEDALRVNDGARAGAA